MRNMNGRDANVLSFITSTRHKVKWITNHLKELKKGGDYDDVQEYVKNIAYYILGVEGHYSDVDRACGDYFINFYNNKAAQESE